MYSVTVFLVLNLFTFSFAHQTSACAQYSKFVCQDSILAINCEGNKVIKIRSANYGRTIKGDILCPHSSYDTSKTFCWSPNVTEIVTEMCDNHQSCSIKANNQVFGNPCDGTWKYLEVTYECEDRLIKKHGCESEVVDLECNNGALIEIKSAMYGRMVPGSVICLRPNSDKNLNCRSAVSLENVKKRCENQPKCQVPASNLVFGDPCAGIDKYLEVEYTCKTTCAQQRKLVCEKSLLSINCEANEEIKIKSANYGRTVTGDILCPHSSLNTNKTDCWSSSSIETVKKMCDKRQSCSIQADNQVFGDPCVGTSKYLEVTYECEDRKKKKHGCEAEIVELECNDGELIEINNAIYGRVVPGIVICPRPNSDKNLNCRSAVSLENVKKRCEKRPKCQVPASYTIFGDPCAGTDKYLEVEYSCKKTKIACEESTMILKCNTDEVLKIESANYGRELNGDIVCQMKGNDTFTNCYSSNAIDIVKIECDDRQFCTINANNGVFGDPCVGTRKYLEVTYRCEQKANQKDQKANSSVKTDLRNVKIN